MSGPTQGTVFDHLDVIADDPLPIKRDTREAVRIAINEVARAKGGRFTSADLRRHYPAWHVPEQVGPTLRRLRLRKHIHVTSHAGRYGSAGNGDKPAPMYEVITYPIPPEAVQP